MVITSMSWDITPIIIGIQPLFFLELQPQELLHMSSGAKFLSRAHIASYIIQDVQTVIILIPVFSRISTSRSSCPWWMYMYNCYYTCYLRIPWILLVKRNNLKLHLHEVVYLHVLHITSFYMFHTSKKTCPPVNRNIPAECLVGDGGSDLAKKRPKKIIERAEHLNQSLGSKWSKLQEWNMIKD
jgi:hypothetical protein